MIEIKDIRALLVSPLPPPAGGDSTWSKRFLKYCADNNLNMYHVNTALIGKRSENASDSFNIFDEIKRTKRIWKEIKTILKNEHIDIAHINTNCSPKGLIRDYYSSKKIWKKKIKYIVHCRCNVHDQIRDSKMGLKYFKKLCSHATLVFVQNSFSLEYVKTIGINNVMLMPNCIEGIFIKDKEVINEHIKDIAFVGHIKKTKGIREILDVAKKMENINFHLAGPLSEENLKTDMKNVRFYGELSSKEVKDLLDKSDILLFPTYTEGFSNSLLEAMARGLPAITTNVGANLDMLENKGGIILKENNAECIIEAINKLDDKKIRESQSKWCVEKVNSTYKTDVVFSKIWNIYKDLLNESN